MRKEILIIITVLLLTGCSNEPAIINESNNVLIETNEIITNEITTEEDIVVIVEDPMYIRVLGETLNVRESSNENSEVVATVAENDIFLVQEEYVDDQNRVWYKIDSEDQWVAGWFCKEITVSDVINADSYACINIESETAEVLDHYSEGNKVYDALKGSKYKIIDTYFDSDNVQWYKIIDRNGSLSWVLGDDCSEYLSSDTKKIEITKKVNDLLKDNHSIGDIGKTIDNYSENNRGIRLDYIVIAEDTQIFTIVYDELSYLCLIDNSNLMGQIVSSNDYYRPFEMVLNDYAIMEHLYDNQRTYKILNFNSIDTFEEGLELPITLFYRNDKNDILLYEEDRIDEDTGLRVEHLTDLKYYKISTNESIVYKRASSNYDWVLKASDSESNVLKIIRNDWNDGSVEEKVELMDYDLYNSHAFKESKPYLVFGDIDEHLSAFNVETFDENIIYHMMALEKITIYTTVEVLSDFETETHLYFEIKYHPREIWGEEYLLVSWEKNNKSGAEIINRKSFGSIEEYMAVTLEDASKASIIEYMQKIPLSFYDIRLEYFESFETDQFMFFGVGQIDAGGPEEYKRIVFWEKDNVNGGYVSEKNTQGISKIIEENMFITTYQDFMTYYGFYNLNNYGTDDFEIGTIEANQYNQLGDSDWIIFESAHPYKDNSWSPPFVTEIDFLNIRTGEFKKYLISDEAFDWTYSYDENNRDLRIIKKKRGKNMSEGEYAVLEVIDLDDLQEFILKIEAL